MGCVWPPAALSCLRPQNPGGSGQLPWGGPAQAVSRGGARLSRGDFSLGCLGPLGAWGLSQPQRPPLASLTFMSLAGGTRCHRGAGFCTPGAVRGLALRESAERVETGRWSGSGCVQQPRRREAPGPSCRVVSSGHPGPGIAGLIDSPPVPPSRRIPTSRCVCKEALRSGQMRLSTAVHQAPVGGVRGGHPAPGSADLSSEHAWVTGPRRERHGRAGEVRFGARVCDQGARPVPSVRAPGRGRTAGSPAPGTV